MLLCLDRQMLLHTSQDRHKVVDSETIKYHPQSNSRCWTCNISTEEIDSYLQDDCESILLLLRGEDKDSNRDTKATRGQPLEATCRAGTLCGLPNRTKNVLAVSPSASFQLRLHPRNERLVKLKSCTPPEPLEHILHSAFLLQMRGALTIALVYCSFS